MIEIKFRGKREKDSEWVYGLITYVVFQKSERQFEIHTPLYDSDGFRGIQRYAVFTETIGQFTGLHDKNGKTEGYESDIVRVRWTAELGISEMDFDEIGVIKYNTDSASYGIELVKPIDVTVCEDGVYREEWLPLLKCEEGMHYDWEIIGNIYENPELLK